MENYKSLVNTYRQMKKQVARPADVEVDDQGEKNDEIRTGITAVSRNTHSQYQSKVIDEAVDDEGNMAMGELRAMAAKATEIADMLNSNTQLEGWVQSKITKAKDYVDSVHDYIKFNCPEK
jgi:hypothetical protein